MHVEVACIGLCAKFGRSNIRGILPMAHIMNLLNCWNNMIYAVNFSMISLEVLDLMVFKISKLEEVPDVKNGLIYSKGHAPIVFHNGS